MDRSSEGSVENLRMHMLFLAIVGCPYDKFSGVHSLYCKQYAPRSDCSLRSSLNRVHSVCFHGKSFLECIWMYAADVISR